jgi:2-methylisocitrate lyase-like PEP mutase family enzyme
VAAIHLEDQVIPRCGHVAGRRVVPIEEAVARSARLTRLARDDPIVLIARTDARGAHGAARDAIGRANAYLEAGADVAFVGGPR